MGIQTVYPLSWAVSRAARVTLTIRGIHNRLNYCVNCKVYAEFTIVTMGGLAQTGGPNVANRQRFGVP
jgi:hypothetical protein